MLSSKRCLMASLGSFAAIFEQQRRNGSVQAGGRFKGHSGPAFWIKSGCEVVRSPPANCSEL